MFSSLKNTGTKKNIKSLTPKVARLDAEGVPLRHGKDSIKAAAQWHCGDTNMSLQSYLVVDCAKFHNKMLIVRKWVSEDGEETDEQPD